LLAYLARSLFTILFTKTKQNKIQNFGQFSMRSLPSAKQGYEKNGRGVINGKIGKAASLHKFSGTLNLSQSRGACYAQPLALPHLTFFVITPLKEIDLEDPAIQ
jgi:hypothetical protein